MKHQDKTPASSGSPETNDTSDKKIPKNLTQDEPRAADDSAREIDRPGLAGLLATHTQVQD